MPGKKMKLQNTGQSNTDHSQKPYHDIMDDIDDPDLHNAVSMARDMMRNGISPGLANWKAAYYHAVDVSDVASWVGKIGGQVKRSRR